MISANMMWTRPFTIDAANIVSSFLQTQQKRRNWFRSYWNLLLEKNRHAHTHAHTLTYTLILTLTQTHTQSRNLKPNCPQVFHRRDTQKLFLFSYEYKKEFDRKKIFLEQKRKLLH